MQKLNPESKLRRDLEREVGVRLSNAVWKLLSEENRIDPVLDGEDSIAELAEYVQNWLGALSGVQSRVAPSPKRRQRRLEDSEIQHEGITELLAADARGREDVKGFRKLYLQSGLLELSQVSQWVRAHAGPAPKRRVAVELPAGETITLDAPGVFSISDRARREAKLVNIIAPPFVEFPGNDGWIERIPVSSETLDALYIVSRQVGNTFGWQQAAATAFVLTDIPPHAMPVRYSVTMKSWASTLPGFKKANRSASLGWLNLEFPAWLSPRELANVYGRIRREALSGQSGRTRTLKSKRIRLAMFAAARPADLTAADMREWNRARPHWRYRELGIFRRDAADAQRRLLHNPLRLV